MFDSYGFYMRHCAYRSTVGCLTHLHCCAGLKADRAEFPDIESALQNAVNQRNLQQHSTWLNKCIQLYETYLVRHGIMVVGPAGGGKSSILECLAAALTELGTKHVIWRMNPKAITAPQMFGRYGSFSHFQPRNSEMFQYAKQLQVCFACLSADVRTLSIPQWLSVLLMPICINSTLVCKPIPAKTSTHSVRGSSAAIFHLTQT